MNASNQAMQLTASRPVVTLGVSAVETVCCLACTEGSRQLILCLVRPMRAMLFVAMCVISTGCMKSVDIEPWPPVTQITLGRSELTHHSFLPENGHLTVDLPKLRAFIDGHRHGWTRAIAVGFGPPSPAWYAHLYEGDKYLGYFAVGAGALPGSAGFFRVQYAEVFAQKRVTAAEANRFLDLIGVGGELAESIDNEIRQQIAKRPSATRAAVLVERPAKFQPGDRVRVKLTKVEGVVALRTRLFRRTGITSALLALDVYFTRSATTRNALRTMRTGDTQSTSARRTWKRPVYGSELEPAP